MAKVVGMDANNPTCPESCGEYAPGDNYCRRCGMYVATPELVQEEQSLVISDEPPLLRALAPQRAGLPAPAARVAAAVAVGTALQVGVAIFARYIASSAARPPAARPPRVSRRAITKVEPAEKPVAPVMDDGVIAVIESVTFRRIWMKRNTPVD